MAAVDIGAPDAVAEAVHAVHTHYPACKAGAAHTAEKQADHMAAEKVDHMAAEKVDHRTAVTNMKSTNPVLALVVEEERPVAAGRRDANCTEDVVQVEVSYRKKEVVQYYNFVVKVLG